MLQKLIMIKLKNNLKVLILPVSLILVLSFSRLIPHPYNFTPILAVGVFGGFYFKNFILSLFVVITSMFVGDLVIGFHSTMWAVYGAFGLIALLGIFVQNKINVISMIGASLGASLLFFAITNFAVWTTGAWYPATFSGLIECYIAAIPFFGKTIVSDLLFTGVFVGGFMFAQSKIPALARVKS